jgi:hypothetical protein
MEIVVPGQRYGRLQTIDIIASVRAVPPRGHDSCQTEIETGQTRLFDPGIRAAVVLVRKVNCLAAPQARSEGNKVGRLHSHAPRQQGAEAAGDGVRLS